MSHHLWSRRRKRPCPSRMRGWVGQRGFALLATLWLSMAITTVVLAFALEARRDRVAVANLAESSQAVAVAQGCVATVMSHLDRLSAGTAPTTVMPYDPTDPWQWVDTLLSEKSTVDGLPYTVRVQDADALLDINRASENDWRSFLSALNVDYTTADRLAQTISDWRDPDNDARSSGAERSDYVHAGRLVLPTNRNFRSVDELRNVMGMTPAVFHLIQPYLGVGTSDGRISVNTASAAVLRTIPAFTDDIVTVILGRRAIGSRIQSIEELVSMTGNARLAVPGGGVINRVTFTTQTVELACMGSAPGGHTSVTLNANVARGTPTATIRWRQIE